MAFGSGCHYSSLFEVDGVPSSYFIQGLRSQRFYRGTSPGSNSVRAIKARCLSSSLVRLGGSILAGDGLRCWANTGRFCFAPVAWSTGVTQIVNLILRTTQARQACDGDGRRARVGGHSARLVASRMYSTVALLGTTAGANCPLEDNRVRRLIALGVAAVSAHYLRYLLTAKEGDLQVENAGPLGRRAALALPVPPARWLPLVFPMPPGFASRV